MDRKKKDIGAYIPNKISVSEIISVYKVDFRNVIGLPELHDYPEIIYIISGTHTLILDGEHYKLEAGQLLIYPPNAVHLKDKPSEATAFILTFRAEWRKIETIYKKIIDLTDEQREMLDRLMKRAFKSFDVNVKVDGVYKTIPNKNVGEDELQLFRKQFEIFLLEISMQIATNEEKRESITELEEIVKYFDQHIEETLSLERIATANLVSVSKLKRIFKNNVGSGPINYFIDMKIDKAIELIIDGEYNISQIAEKLGFNSLHYFSRIFKKRTGYAPSEYIRKCKKSER